MALSIRWTTAAAVSLYLSVSLSAQEAPRAPQEQVFGESIDVRVVNVEAVVTDRGGTRVRGLAAGDFRLLVDGKGVYIDVLSPWTQDAAALAAALDQARQRPANGAVTMVHRESPQSEVTLLKDSAQVLADGDSSGPDILLTELAALGGDAVSTDAYS